MTFTVEESQRSELLCTYAALILQDDNAPITAENIQTLVKASNNTCEAYWPGLIANLLDGKDAKALILAGGGGSSGGGSGAAAAGGDAAAAAEPEPEPEEEEEEEEADMGFSLFD